MSYTTQDALKAAAPTSKPDQTYVWDPFVRIFHWSVVVAFAVAYLTDDDLLAVHVWAGYLIGILLAIRVVWGFMGPKYARFADFVRGPRSSTRYILDMLRLRGERHLGHSPGGGAMILLMLVLLAATVITGVIVYGGDQGAGPLAGIISHDSAERLEEVHELLANITLTFVCVHVAAVVLVSIVNRENLVRAMFTGYKRS